MSRITWFAAGAATGVYGIFRARRAARNLTPDGLAARAAAVTAGVKVFTSTVSTGMAEREGQLRDQLAAAPSRGVHRVPAMLDGAIDGASQRPVGLEQGGSRVGHR